MTLPVVLNVLSWICLVTGSLFCIIGAVGLLRMPDFYTRTHAAGITDTMGATLVLVGLMFQAGLTLVLVKLIMILLFMYLVGPAAGHALFKAAYAQGVKIFDPAQGASSGGENAVSD